MNDKINPKGFCCKNNCQTSNIETVYFNKIILLALKCKPYTFCKHIKELNMACLLPDKFMCSSYLKRSRKMTHHHDTILTNDVYILHKQECKENKNPIGMTFKK